MIFRLFRRSANAAVIERLYAGIVAAARHPALFTDLGMNDTFEGRFESLTLHAAIVLRRLNGCPAPGPEVAQDVIDTVFRHFDRTLREIGVGDTTVPKRMKRMAEAFLGRSAAYDEALRNGHQALVQALSRNIVSRDQASASQDDLTPNDGERLAHYVEAAVAGLEHRPLQAFIEGEVPFPDPARFASGDGA